MAGFTVAPWLVPWNLHRASKQESKSVTHPPKCLIQLVSRFVDFAMHRVRMLQHFNVTPYIVFDGDYLPSKAATEADRAKRREESKKAGFELLKAGKASQAYLEFQKAVDVTPEMARQLIDDLKKSGVQYLVAPYEADAQMVYLERKGIIDGILSEDSDLLVFGAKCLLTKLDQYGNCIEINKADFCACREISLTGWSDSEFRQMAILSGCDYLASISNMGLKTAYRMVRKHKTIEKVVRMLQFDGKFVVPKGYLEAFHQAELTFLHQRVFCPVAQTLVLHTEPHHPIDVDKMPFIGAYVEPKIAQGVASGDLNPMTKLPILLSSSKKMVTTTTPWTSSRPKHQASVSSVDPKKDKPLESFFKPKRSPLSELDINCFTPSPTQQEALRRNSGAAWAASPAPRPYLHRSATDPEHSPQSAPQLNRNQILRTVRAPTVSEPRPLKRPRLCADIDIVLSPSRKVQLGASPFFTSVTAEPSPTVGRIVRSKRSKKQDITIFSDDSIEEAMLSLPDVHSLGTTRPRSNSKIQILETSRTTSTFPLLQTQNSAEVVRPKCHRSGGVDAPAESQDTIPSLTSSMSMNSSAEQPPTPTEINLVSGSSGTLKSRFAFAVDGTYTPKFHGDRQGLPTPSSSLKPSRIPLAIKSNTPASKMSAKANLTPLQRLGATAINRLNFPATPPLTPTSAVKPKSPRRSLLSKGNVPFPEVERGTKWKNIGPASIPLPIPDEAERAALSMQNGSEDMIFHESEEDESFSPIPEAEYEPARQIDFSSYAFVAKA